VLFHETLNSKPWRAYEHEERSFALFQEGYNLESIMSMKKGSSAMCFFMKTLNPIPWRAYEHEERSFALSFSKKAMTWRAL
jgi:hypothetical protein